MSWKKIPEKKDYKLIGRVNAYEKKIMLIYYKKLNHFYKEFSLHKPEGT